MPKKDEYQVMLGVGAEHRLVTGGVVAPPERVGTMPIRQDIEVIPATNPEKLLLDFAPDKEGYFHTGVKEDDPMLGKGDEHFASLLGMSAGGEVQSSTTPRDMRKWRDQTPEEVTLVAKAMELGARNVRIIPAHTPEYLDAHMGRLHIYLDDENKVRRVNFEMLYCKWKMSDEPATIIYNVKALDNLRSHLIEEDRKSRGNIDPR